MGVISIDTISTSVVPWLQVEVDASECQTADEAYEQLRIGIGAMLSQNKERISAVSLRVLGTSDAHAELNRDFEQIRHEKHSESMLSAGADELFDHTQ